ncbi:MAG TPA: electron transport complex subunit RsxA [Clostridia bacterium]|nr:electron transport complex subunit RsxA [Clostridia bacterium]
MKIALILVSAIFINNFILSQFLGICPFLGVSKRIDTAIGMSVAVTFVMGLASVICWFVQYFILDPMGIGYLQTIAFILVIAGLVQFVEMVIKKTSPTLYQALGIYLPLITTNCAVLGVAILNITKSYNVIESLINGVGGGLGFSLAIVLFAGVRERLEFAPTPKALEGFPIAMLAASLFSIAFLGFSGLFSGLL